MRLLTCFLAWVDDGRLEEKTKKFYRNGWRLLKATPVAGLRVNQITGDFAEQFRFPASAANANCALRTLRGILHKAEEWKMIGRAPKIKMMKEHGRHLRLDDEAEKRLLAGASVACEWRQRTRELFRDIVILMRDTGMRNQRELYRTRIENLDWENRVIFVPDSKTPEGRRLVPMGRRVLERLRARCGTRAEAGCFRPSVLLRVTFAQSIGCFERRGNKPASRRNWSFIVPAMTTAPESSCEPGTWPRS